MEGEIDRHLGSGGQLLRNRAFLKLLSSPLLIVTPRPCPPHEPSQMGRFDLGLFSSQKARATAWHSLWEGGHDRQGPAHSQSFSRVTCLRPHVDRKEASCET